jgi:integration host factor subunit beta
VPVPSKRLPFFKVGKELKELVNTSRHSPLVHDDDDDDADDGNGSSEPPPSEP